MKKGLKLKKWVKVTLTVLIIGISLLIYSKTSTLGLLARDSKFYELVTLGAWGWITIGQIASLYILWED